MPASCRTPCRPWSIEGLHLTTQGTCPSGFPKGDHSQNGLGQSSRMQRTENPRRGSLEKRRMVEKLW